MEAKNRLLKWSTVATVAIALATLAIVVLVLVHVGTPPSSPSPFFAPPGEADDEGREMLRTHDRAATARELGRRKSSGALAYLIPYLKDPDPDVRQTVAWALGEIGDPRPVMDLSLRLDNEPAPAVRIAIVHALEALGATREPPGLSAVADRLRDEDETVRLKAVHALARVPGEVTAVHLADAVGDTAPAVRLAAVAELARRDGPSALSGLARALADPHADVRAAAGEGVARAGPDIVPYLEREMASSRDLEARVAAARALAARGDPTVVPAVLALLDHIPRRAETQARALRDAVVEALTPLGAAVVEPLVAETIDGEAAPLAEDAAAEVCVRIGQPAARPITQAILRWKIFPDPGELGLWIAALGEIGDPAAVPALDRALAQDIDGMDALVAEAREKIEARSGAELPPPSPDAGLLFEPPGPRAEARVRKGEVRLTPTDAMGGRLPDNGIVRLRLPDAIVGFEVSGGQFTCDLDVELRRRDGKWAKAVHGHATRLNKREHDGWLVEAADSGQGALRVAMVFHDDRFRRSAFGEYQISPQQADDRLGGNYQGHCNYQDVSGPVTGLAWHRPWVASDAQPPESGEHPRLLFRETDVPLLKERARTPFGRRILRALRARVARQKRLYRTPLNWVTNWQSGIDLAIAHGFLAVLYDDPPHGRRAAPLLIDRTRTMPYPGEHGERMPGPQFHYPFAFDLVYDFLLPDEREEVVLKRGNIDDLFSVHRGPMGVIAASRGLDAVPGATALAFLREKGPFNLRRPEPPPPILTLEPDARLEPRNGMTVNPFVPGRMLDHVLFAGPFTPRDEGHPLDSLGGCESARPVEGTEVQDAGRALRFALLPPSARRVMPPPMSTEFFEIPLADPGAMNFVYAVLNVERSQGCLVEQRAPFGQRWSRVWINGRPIDDGTVVILEPGRHRVLLEVAGTAVSPRFAGVNVGYAKGRARKHEWLMQRYLEAKERHEQTGEFQEIPLVLDRCCRNVRTGLWGAVVEDPSRGRGGWGDLMGPFIAAFHMGFGEGLWPDTPLDLAAHPDRLADVHDQDLCFLVGTVPEGLKPAVVAEFNRRFLPDGLHRLSSLQLIGAFVNYPLDLAP